jgi:hypothetical protein
MRIKPLGKRCKRKRRINSVASRVMMRCRCWWLTVVFPAEGDLVGLTLEEASVGDGHPVGIASQVLENLLGTPKRRFRVDHPIGLLELLEKVAPEVGFRQVLKFTVPGELSQPIGFLQVMEKLFSKQTREDADRQKESGAGGDPTPAVWREASGGDQTVQVGVVLQGLAPGMQDSHKSDMGTEMLGISGNRQ